jgi:hypothetical protein
MNGHIFVWKYEKDFLTSKQLFEPSNKFRIAMEYSKFIRNATSENRIFPEPTAKKIEATKNLD